MWRRRRSTLEKLIEDHSECTIEPGPDGFFQGCKVGPPPYECPAWEAYKAAAVGRLMADWDNQTGTCLHCDLPMRLHPPGRAAASTPGYCLQAALRAEQEKTMTPPEPVATEPEVPRWEHDCEECTFLGSEGQQ